MHFWMRRLLTISLLLFPAMPMADPAKVVRVHDGDTITVLDDDEEQHRIRMASIDAPELGQPYGRAARQELADLVAGKMVEIEPTDTDRYGRTIAVVLLNSGNVNREMVSRGVAWSYLKYLDDPVLVNLEADARSTMRGLWAQQADQIMSPWECAADCK
jgi:endonuclease YncB( thermonuclease family)